MAVPRLPDRVILMMADRAMRMHHYLWHSVRNNWLLSYDDAIKESLRAIGWEPPRPAMQRGADGRAGPILDNDSGEDFLFMHREMIADINRVLADVGQPDYPRVEGWKAVPRPDDPDYPVPPPYETGEPDLDAYLREVKSDEFFHANFIGWEEEFTDPDRLRAMSLGELGARIEFSIHNQMHMRWSEPVAAIRPDASASSPSGIDPRWDQPSYDWLGDSYSSHVHPVFWRLHGWVDDRIEDWRRANAIAGPIPWKGTWEGPEAHIHGPEARRTHHVHGDIVPMDEAAAIVAENNEIRFFADAVTD